MGELTPETTEQLLSTILDCLVALDERCMADTVEATAVAQMRHWADLIQAAMSDD